MKKIWLKFRYKDKEYYIETDRFLPFWDEEWEHWNWFWWEEGNGGCDCNRSITIREKYPDFPDMGCGDEIELYDYDFLKE